MSDAWGIEPSFEDAYGHRRRVPRSTIEALRSSMGDAVGDGDGPLVIRAGTSPDVGPATLLLEDGSEIHIDSRLPPDVPLGYHDLIGSAGRRRLIVSPGRCHLPRRREWGWAVQLYAARSRRSWGMGDLGDLATLARWSRGQGAGFLLVNPLLAVAPTSPRQPSPYSPATRRFLDPIYLRVEEVAGAGEVDITRAVAAGHALDDDPLIRRDAVWRIKREALEAMFAVGPTGAFREWSERQGPELQTFAAWSALAETHGGDWRTWPHELHDSSGAAVARFVADHTTRVDFHRWLQWQARAQLDQVAEQITLLQDLPIGFDPGGMDAWEWQDLILFDTTVGAPPDEFNTLGQDWGIPPFAPHRLRRADYEPFIQTIRANLAAGGGLRIDHVMGLFRLYAIPAGSSPAEGAYIRYPSSDLLDIIALESARSEAFVVGEDLGTVEPGVREAMAERRMLSYRLLWFEEGRPERWPAVSMASVTTHDLPTVAGLWTGADLDEQRRLDLEPNVASTQRIRSRVASFPGIGAGSPAEVVGAVHRQLARTPSRLLCATLEDAALAERRPNIPGADPDRPNWSLSLPRPIDEIVDDEVATSIAQVLDRATREEAADAQS